MGGQPPPLRPLPATGYSGGYRMTNSGTAMVRSQGSPGAAAVQFVKEKLAGKLEGKKLA